MQTLLQDLRYGVRMLLKKPSFALIVILTLTFGVGANTILFSVVNAVLLRPLPYKEPERLMTVWETFIHQGNVQNPVTPSNFFDWREQNSSFESLAFYTPDSRISLTEAGEPAKVNAVFTSDGFMQVLGSEPVLGRVFVLGEVAQSDNVSVVVISHGLWQRRFGGEASVIGKQVRVDGGLATIIGVMPPSFQFPSDSIDMWAPAKITPPVSGTPQGHYLRVLGRLKSGVSAKQAQADLDGIAARLREQYPQTNRYIGVEVNPLHKQLTGDIRGALLILLAATGFVLLIACVNVANLLLARAATRHKEIAIRLAMGAGRWRIIRQLLTESALLAILGGAGGLLLALWGVPVLAALTPQGIAQARAASVDARVLIFTLGVSLLTALLFGLVPAWQATNPNLNESLKEGGRETTGAGRGWVRSSLVVAEIALALVLLIGGGLLLKSFARLSSIDPGFRADHLLTLEVFPPYAKYGTTAQRAAFYDELLQRVQALPGVEAAGVVTALPAKTRLAEMTWITEQKVSPKIIGAVPLSSSAEYFRTLEMPLLAGRIFNSQDTPNAPGVVIINEAMARAAWPGENVIGKRMKMGVETQPWLTVAGVVKDARLRLGMNPMPQVYMPYTQTPAYGPGDLAVRTKIDPTALAAAVRREVQAMDKDQPIANVQTMNQLLADSIQRPRFNTLLLAIFSMLALALAAIGIYGVMSYTVTQNLREIGIRMALGAQRRDIFKLVVGQGVALTLVGVAAGIAGAFGLTRLLATLLFGVTATDPLTFVSVPVLLVVVALLACWLPARRATKVDPMVALRCE